jgi:hypothetical protein
MDIDSSPTDCHSIASIKKLEGSHFSLSPGATFGGILSPDGCDFNRNTFLKGLPTHLQPDGSEITVSYTDVPNFYDLTSAGLSTKLPDWTHPVTRFDPCHYLHLPSWTLKSLSRGNQKKYRRSTEANFEYSKLDSSKLLMLFTLLQRNRNENSLEMPVSFELLQRQMNLFPADYALHAIADGSEIIAGAITVDVWPQVNYVFMWAHDREWSHYSPTVALCVNIIEWNRGRGIEFMDLGTSGTEFDEQINLSRFKENLGAIRSQRPHITLRLSNM